MDIEVSLNEYSMANALTPYRVLVSKQRFPSQVLAYDHS